MQGERADTALEEMLYLSLDYTQKIIELNDKYTYQLSCFDS